MGFKLADSEMAHGKRMLATALRTASNKLFEALGSLNSPVAESDERAAPAGACRDRLAKELEIGFAGRQKGTDDGKRLEPWKLVRIFRDALVIGSGQRFLPNCPSAKGWNGALVRYQRGELAREAAWEVEIERLLKRADLSS